MAETKTKATKASVTDFLDQVKNEQKRKDAYTVLQLMKTITRKQPKMWGPTIVGFDKYHYRYDSGHEGDMCMIGFSPRSAALTLYLMPDFAGHDQLLRKLGKYKRSKACLYINKLADVDLKVLGEIIKASYQHARQRYA